LRYAEPPYWSPSNIIQYDRCPDISGKYSNDGNNLGTRDTSYLYDDLTVEGLLGTHECEKCPVDIHWIKQDEEMSVSIESDKGIITKLLKKESGDFYCQDGQLLIDYSQGGEAIVEGYLRKGTRVFQRGKNGSLMKTDKFSVYGHILIFIPYVFNEIIEYAQWWPFEYILDEEAANNR
jgi:hypothetical protein